ncbi:MAG: (2Fe-2S)-binding protein [Mizugakiibacter sp.]|uniref:(2Fe-2S)-binding protein n=1 Tax=Mizugakiibacter sp. TaxID=1972610 RepID=UPI0032115345
MQQQPLQAPPPPSEIRPEPKRDGIDVVINGERFRHYGDPAMPLLWYLRDVLRLTGSKYGCGIGACGACTVLVDGQAMRSCVTPVSALKDRHVTTVEGLADAQGNLHALQQAWIDEDVAQCGYCQAGQLMAAADLLKRKPDPSDDDIDTIANLCRCGTYPRIRKAIKRAAAALKEGKA